MPLRAAVIDLGSLAVRLHVAEAPGARPAVSSQEGEPPGPFRSLHEERRISRLAENLKPGGDLSPQGRDRVLRILRDFQAAIERFGVEGRLTKIVATEALRKARNGSDFAKRIERELGLPTLLLSPEEEARWTARGALLTGTALPRPILIADPGGGSVEVIWVEAAEADGGELPLRYGSEPLGVLDLLGRFPLEAPADPGVLAKLESEVEGAVEGLLGRVTPPGERAASLRVTGGTALNLAAINRKTPPQRLRAFFETTIGREELEAIYRRLAASDMEARKNEPCLERGREDVIVHGLAILRGLIRVSGVGSLSVTHSGLREGILDALLAGEETPNGIPRIR